MTTYVLLIRPGAIGDTLLLLPVIQAMREQSKSLLHITLIGNATVLPLALACGVIDEAYDYQDRRWANLFSTDATRIQHDTVIQRSERVICWLRDPDGIVRRNLQVAGIQQITVVPGRSLADNGEEHCIEYLARTAGLRWTFAQDGQDTRLFLPGECSVQGKRSIAVHVGSGGASKCWPLERFVAVIQALWQRAISVLVLAGPAEYERLEQLRKLLNSPPAPELVRILVDMPLLLVAEELRLCRGYLGNDTGLTHLAGLLGVPVVALFGPSCPGVWHPPGPAVRVLSRSTLDDITIEEVIASLNFL